nr:sigma-E processing peptidase SpoIIGA [uncultured Blautia sp.]
MYQEIYIDVVFAANLLMDYLLLRLVGKFLRYRVSRRRCLAAAVFGALGSCLILWIPSENTPVLTVVLHGFFALGMLRIGLRIQKGALLLKAFLMLYLTAFLCGGFWEAVSGERILTIKVFLLCVFVVYTGSSAFLFAADSIRAGRRNIYPVTLGYQGKVESAYGFYDSGNLLEDPVSGKPVSIIEADLLEKILPEEYAEALKNLNGDPKEFGSVEIAGLKPHYLSVKTVGKSPETFLAVMLDDLCIHTPGDVIHIAGPVFALTFESSALGREYKLLLNSRLLR